MTTRYESPTQIMGWRRRAMSAILSAQPPFEPLEERLLARLVWAASSEPGNEKVSVSQNDLAGMVGGSAGRVRAALARLERAGYLSRVRPKRPKAGESGVIRVTLPTIEALALDRKRVNEALESGIDGVFQDALLTAYGHGQNLHLLDASLSPGLDREWEQELRKGARTSYQRQTSRRKHTTPTEAAARQHPLAGQGAFPFGFRRQDTLKRRADERART